MIAIKILHIVAYALVFVGGLNWGLVGLLDMNLVALLLGAWPTLEKLVYVLVGLSGVGKSSIIAALTAHSTIATNNVSLTGLGKHTTTSTH